MGAAPRTLLLCMVIMISAEITSAQRSTEITITEPAVINVAGLFKQADTVALVEIVSGDTENYSVVIYKGKVIRSFKGAEAGQTVYFGPYIGQRLGWKYFLFLRNANREIAPTTTSGAGYGTVHYAEVFNEGYTSM